MGQAVYVLTTRMNYKDKLGKAVQEWRPVGVVSNAQVADEWKYESDNNDWIPLELDDMSTVEGEHSVSKFTPRKPVPAETRAEQAIKNVNEVNTRLIDIVETLAKRYKDKEVLKLVQQLKSQPQAEKPSQKVMGSADPNQLAPDWRKSHTQDCAAQEEGNGYGDCTCMNDVLSFNEDLSGKWTLRGCKDCGANEQEGDDGHRPGCPRISQKSLFTSSLLRKQNGNPDA